MHQDRFPDFIAQIARVNGLIQKLKSRYSEAVDLKAVHVFWVYLLSFHPEGMSASQLAAAGQIARSLVSREIAELIDKGIVETAGPGGQRRYGEKLRLTEKGREVADGVARFALAHQDAVSRDIPMEDLMVFYRTLHLIADNLESIINNENSEEQKA